MRIVTILAFLSVFNTLGMAADEEKSKPDAKKPPVDVITKPAKVDKTEKLTKTESLALESLNTRQNGLQADIKEYSVETCKAHKIEPDACQINPQDLTVSKLEHPNTPPPAKPDSEK